MDAIAEFVLVTNRFDATQGRSSGHARECDHQVRARTRLPGTLSGFFRNDRFNAADFIQQRVLPYSNQQMSGTFGGPIRPGPRALLRATTKYEREPRRDLLERLPGVQHRPGWHRTGSEGRGPRGPAVLAADALSRRAARNTTSISRSAARGGATSHPSTARRERPVQRPVFSTLTQVLSNRAVNEVKAGSRSTTTARLARDVDGRLLPSTRRWIAAAP